MDIDWSEIYRQLESTRMILERGPEITTETRMKVLKARAMALAKEPEREEAGREHLEVLQFQLAQETYGLEASYIQQVLKLTRITPLPGVPSFVMGVVGVGGRIVSVIDLKKLFGLPEKGLPNLNKIIIVRKGEMVFGILADAVLGMCRLAADEIETCLPALTGVYARYLKGVTRDRLIVLDAGRIIGDKSMVIDQEEEAR